MAVAGFVGSEILAITARERHEQVGEITTSGCGNRNNFYGWAE
jgi:hypothetical protein